MKQKSKFEILHPGPFEVVVFGPNHIVSNDMCRTETAAVRHARRLLMRDQLEGYGAAVFKHDGKERRGVRRSFKKIGGVVTEDDRTKVLR